MEQIGKAGGQLPGKSKMPATMMRGIIKSNHVKAVHGRLKAMAEGTYVRPAEDLSKKGASKDDLTARTRFGEFRGGVFYVNKSAKRDHEAEVMPPAVERKLKERKGGKGKIAKKYTKKKGGKGKKK